MNGNGFGGRPSGAVERIVDLVLLGETTAARHGRDVPSVADYADAMAELYRGDEVVTLAAAAIRAHRDDPLRGASAAVSILTAAWAKELAIVTAAVIYPLARTLAEHEERSVADTLAGLVDAVRGDHR